LIGLSMVGYCAFAASRLSVSLAAIHLQAPTYVVGLLLSLYALLPMLFSVSLGRWVDRIGTRRPMLIGLAGLMIAYLVPAVWTELPALFFNSAAAGLSFMMFHICVQKLTGEIGDEADRVRNFGLLSVGYSASGFIGPVSAGWLIDHVGGDRPHRAVFILSFALVVLTFALLKWRLRFVEQAGVQPVSRQLKGRVLDLLKTRQLRQLYIAVVMIASAWELQMFLVPVQGSKVGLSAGQIGVVLGAFSAATFTVRTLIPQLSRRFSEWQLIGLAQCVSAVVYLAFPLVSSHYGLTALAFALGLGLGVGHPSVMALLHKVTPAGRLGEAVGLRMAMVTATQTALPTAFGALGTALSTVLTGSLVFAPMFWGIALMVGVGGVSALRNRHD
jgi:MFS family permease